MRVWIALLLFLQLAASQPGVTICDYGWNISTVSYNVFNRVEFESASQPGNQCVTITNYADDSVDWEVRYSWGAHTEILKAWPHARYTRWEPNVIRDHESIPLQWEWT